MRLLIVEDDAVLRGQLQQALAEAGFAVDVAADGEDGLHCALEYALDLAVIDVGLPKRDGISVVRELRKNNKTYPVLILTARDHWTDKVNGLEAGADDYLTKPFHLAELKARINALLRRSAGVADPVLRHGRVELDTRAKTLTVGGAEVAITAYEYKVLEYLMLHAGEAISKTQLSEHIYDESVERDSNVMEVFIGRLRRKLQAHGEEHLIETVRGQGYRFPKS
jgi:two-component system response regulator PhoP